jgi:hypothetical protein
VEVEDADERRRIGVPLLEWLCEEPCLELVGLGGDALRCLLCPLVDGYIRAVELPTDIGLVGGLASDEVLTSSPCFRTGLGADQGKTGDGGTFADLLLRLSISSSTMFTSKSVGSSMPARFRVKLRS